MRKIEKEEERLGFTEPDKQCFHLCIVNLVIGTLYCAKGNFEFGISRIIKSLDPYEKKLHTDTWFYAKRCFLALAENMCKHMLILKDSSMDEILEFLEKAESAGGKVMTVIGPQVDATGTGPPPHTRTPPPLSLQTHAPLSHPPSCPLMSPRVPSHPLSNITHISKTSHTHTTHTHTWCRRERTRSCHTQRSV